MRENESRALDTVSSMPWLGCPICGLQPSISNTGSCVDVECCVSMSRQKSDVMDMVDRRTMHPETFEYSFRVEAKVLEFARTEWNTRKPNDCVNRPVEAKGKDNG